MVAVKGRLAGMNSVTGEWCYIGLSGRMHLNGKAHFLCYEVSLDICPFCATVMQHIKVTLAAFQHQAEPLELPRCELGAGPCEADVLFSRVLRWNIHSDISLS